MAPESLIPKHGGYRGLKSFQIAQLIYDLTVQFCDRYIDRFSRTRDQMVQAARSGVQNIAEGSQASGTSKKMEIKLTNVARASLEELQLDYEDYLRQRGETPWAPNHPALLRFKKRQCASLEDIRLWAASERIRHDVKNHTDEHGQRKPNGHVVPYPVLVANAALSLINLCAHLLDRQVAAQAKDFENHGGFTERMYRVRTANRKQQP